MVVAVNVTMIISALIWIVLGSVIMYKVSGEGDCSCWWAKSIAIMFIIQGACALLLSFVSMLPKKEIKN